jgi:hypothetical protein
MILNVDGSSIGNPGISGFGGLIRNSHGAWIRGVAGNIGCSNILHAECIMEHKRLICYSDFIIAIKLIEDPINEWHHFASILHNIKDLLARD